jgi:hypothetical protein
VELLCHERVQDGRRIAETMNVGKQAQNERRKTFIHKISSDTIRRVCYLYKYDIIVTNYFAVTSYD